MKLIVQVVCTALLSFLAQQWLPWWSAAACAALVGVGLPTGPWVAFRGGFVSISLLWTLKAAAIDAKTKAILSTKMATLFGLPSPLTLILLTGLVGGLVGGLGAWSGQQLRKGFRSSTG